MTKVKTLSKADAKALLCVKRNKDGTQIVQLSEAIANAHRALQELDFDLYAMFTSRAYEKFYSLMEHQLNESKRINEAMIANDLSLDDAKRIKQVWYLR